MIEEHMRDVIPSKPVFSTRQFDVFLLRTPGKYVGDTHTDILDMYVAYKRNDDEREEWCPSPICTVYVEHERYKDGGVLNRVYKCSILPPLGGALLHPRNIDTLISRK